MGLFNRFDDSSRDSTLLIRVMTSAETILTLKYRISANLGFLGDRLR